MASSVDPSDAASAMPEPKIKHDWYQTEANIVIEV
jgi:hypothetical protein